EALAEELGRRIEFKQYAFASLLPGLERGDFDFAMNGLEVTPERKERVRFSRPYYAYKLQLVVRADETRFTTLQGAGRLKGVQVGTLEGCSAERVLDSWGIPKRSYDSQA